MWDVLSFNGVRRPVARLPASFPGLRRCGLLRQQLQQVLGREAREILDDGERGLEIFRRQRGGHGHAAHTSAVGGLLAEHGIFEHDAVFRLHAQPGGGAGIGVGVGLAPGHVVLSNDHVEVAAQVEVVEDVAERGAALAGAETDFKALIAGRLQEINEAGQGAALAPVQGAVEELALLGVAVALLFGDGVPEHALDNKAV